MVALIPLGLVGVPIAHHLDHSGESADVIEEVARKLGPGAGGQTARQCTIERLHHSEYELTHIAPSL